jgi:hypothetical protein
MAEEKADTEHLSFISYGEWADKLSVLHIKEEKLRRTPEKVAIIRKAIEKLNNGDVLPPFPNDDYQALKNINSLLWEVEDSLRDREKRKCFDSHFVFLARCVYHFNDERAKIKREIDRLMSPDIQEVKSYTQY